MGPQRMHAPVTGAVGGSSAFASASVGIPGAPNKPRRAACHMPLSNRLKPEGSPRKPENVSREYVGLQ